jgi:hypothetical protein
MSRSFFLLFLWLNPLVPAMTQIRSDFVLADSAAQPHLRRSMDDKYYVAWVDKKDLRVVYNIFDGSLDPIQVPVKISNTPNPIGPVVSLSIGGGFISWWCQPFPPVSGWRVYGQFLNANGDTSGENFRIDDADYAVPDRRSPDASYLNDTMFVVTWSGNGPSTGDLKGF